MRLKQGAESYQCEYCQGVYVPEKNDDGVRVLDPSDKNCPICKVALHEGSLAHTRILYCTRCRGMLIPMIDFEGLISEERAQQGISRIQPAADTHDLERKIDCPKCQRRMDTHLYAGPGNVVIDSCDACVVNWLDYGELARIADAPDEGSPVREGF